MSDDENRRRFETLALPHLDAAYNLARWLTHNDQDAQDVVQDAMLRAMRYMGSCKGDNAKAWLLQIVRNHCFSWLRQNRPAERLYLEDDAMFNDIAAPATDEPHSAAVRNAERTQVNQAIAALPAAYRDVLVLRELEDLPYCDIARIAGIPVGTVMSRLSRARAAAQKPRAAGERRRDGGRRRRTPLERVLRRGLHAVERSARPVSGFPSRVQEFQAQVRLRHGAPDDVQVG